MNPNPKPTQKIKLFKLDSIAPIRLGSEVFLKIKKRAKLISSEWATSERSIISTAEDEAVNFLRAILDSASTGNSAAARAAHRIAEGFILKINELVLRDSEIWNPILAKANGWPVLASNIPSDIQRNDAILSKVGSDSMLRVVPAAGSKSIRYQVTAMNDILQYLGGCLKVLDAVRMHLSSDSPKDDDFSARIEFLCSHLPHEIPVTGIRGIIKELHKRGGFGRPTKKELAKMIFIWLDLETSGEIQNIDFFRNRGVNSRALDVPDIGHIDEHLLMRKKTEHSSSRRRSNYASITDEERKKFLLHHRGPGAVETAIRGQILRAIQESLNWYNPPAEAHQ
jgi:hypothetical protein